MRENLQNVPTNPDKEPAKQKAHAQFMANLDTLALAHKQARELAQTNEGTFTLFEVKDRSNRFQTHWERESMQNQRRKNGKIK